MKTILEHLLTILILLPIQKFILNYNWKMEIAFSYIFLELSVQLEESQNFQVDLFNTYSLAGPSGILNQWADP